MRRILLLFLFALAGLGAPAAAAPTFPPLTGRVVDSADMLSPGDEAALDSKLKALEQSTSRQLVVATVPDLQGYPVEDYGYQLGRAWGIGQKGANNGLILLVAKQEHKIRIEVGYGLEPVITDALSGQIIADKITPAFKRDDYAGGLNAGVDALIAQLQAPPDQQERNALAAAERHKRSSHGGGGSFFPLIFWAIILVFIIIPSAVGRRHGRRWGSAWPVVIWGPGLGGGGRWGGGGGGGFGGGGFGGGGGGGFGGFSGGGGSFGGGGASGGW